MSHLRKSHIRLTNINIDFVNRSYIRNKKKTTTIDNNMIKKKYLVDFCLKSNMQVNK